MRPSATFRPFHETRVDAVLAEKAATFRQSVAGIAAAVIAGENEDVLADRLAEQHALVVPQFDFDGVTMDEIKIAVPGAHFPIGYGVDRGSSYEKDALLFHVPYSGDAVFLRCYESTRSITGDHRFSSYDGRLSFEVFEFKLTPEVVKQQYDAQIGYLRKYVEPVAYEVAAYNNGLPTRARQLIRERKQKLAEKSELLAKIGVPLTRASAAPATITIPPPIKRRVIHVSMTQTVAGRAPDPTLDEKLYGDVLEVLLRQARAMERTPATYAALGEEDIRNHLLGGLELAFDETSATGETFNMGGKTDILLRHEGHNLFVAECKIWKGSAAYLAAITQLLGYLTWRDSKSAVLLFVRGSELKNVEAAVRDATPTHAEFRAETTPYANGVARYRFDLPRTGGDGVHVAVLLFHLPKG